MCHTWSLSVCTERSLARIWNGATRRSSALADVPTVLAIGIHVALGALESPAKVGEKLGRFVIVARALLERGDRIAQARS